MHHRLMATGTWFTVVALTSIVARADPSPESRAPIFASSQLLTGVQINAPLSDLFKKSRDLTDKDENKDSVKGSLQYVDPQSGAIVTLDEVEFWMRGASSRLIDQCTFAKLSVKLPDKRRKDSSRPTDGTIFEGAKKIKIGTHCGESDVPSPTLARVRNQKEPIREALLYTILNRVGTVTLKARPAVITYVDTSKKVDRRFFPENPLTRNAFFLEHEGESAKRYKATVAAQGGREVKDSRTAGSVNADPLSVVLGIFAETLAENYDWNANNDSSLWNVSDLKTKTGKVLFQVYDWDVCGWVRPQGEQTPGIFVAAAKAISANKNITRDLVNAAKSAYLVPKDQIYADLDRAFPEASTADPEGRSNIKKHLDDFYAWIVKP